MGIGIESSIASSNEVSMAIEKQEAEESDFKNEDDQFETMLKWITTYPTQVNYDKIATGYSNIFTDEQFKKFQAVVDLAQGLGK